MDKGAECLFTNCMAYKCGELVPSEFFLVTLSFYFILLRGVWFVVWG